MPINMNGGAQAHAQDHAQGDRVPPPWERLENSPYVDFLSNQGVSGGKGLPNFPYQGFQALMDNPASQLGNPGMPGISAQLIAGIKDPGGTSGSGGAGGVGIPQDNVP